MRPGLHNLAQSGATGGQAPVWNATTREWEPGTPASALVVQDENSNVATGVTQIDFQGAGVTAAAGTGEVVVTIPGGSLTVQDENSNVSTAVTQIDFQGAGVTATSGTGEVVVTIPGGSSALTVQDENSNVSTSVTQIDFQGAGVTATSGTGEVIVTIPGIGSGAGWDHSLTLPLTSLTNWTAGTGTWTASGAGIRQANTTSGIRRLWYGPLLRQAECVVQVECNIATSGTGTRAGLTLAAPANDGTGGIGVWLRQDTSTAQTGHVDFEREGTTYLGKVSIGTPIANGTWITLRVHKVADHVEAFVNGTYVGGGQINNGYQFFAAALALHSNGTDVTFRNLDVWTPTLP